MKHVLILIAFLTTGSFGANAQWVLIKADGDTILQRGINHIYNVEFEAAHNDFRKVISMYPTHPAGYFLDAMVEWWRIYLDRRNKSADEQFLKKIDKVLLVCDQMLDSTPHNITALFFKGGALGFRGRYHAMRENMFSAADDGRVALDILQECQKIAPGNHDIMLGTGLYNYYAAALPEKYPALKTVMVFLPRGDKVIGLAQLKAAARQAKYAANEAKVVLIQAYFDFEKNPLEAMEFARDLHRTYPMNPAFQRAYGRCLVSLGPLDSMELCWRDLLVRYMDKKTGYDKLAAREALYYIGVARMMSHDPEMALKYFYKCDEACRVLDEDPSGFMVKTNLKIGQIYDQQGKRDLAMKQYRKVLDWDDVGGSHAEAERYMQSAFR
ncbi:MAG: tetratricopeptide repeat protein [Candidatus Kapabacteria bacterium]|nr:tetratricopeptide repeat protein [Candidatus Kapabacteria bacterium]